MRTTIAWGVVMRPKKGPCCGRPIMFFLLGKKKTNFVCEILFARASNEMESNSESVKVVLGASGTRRDRSPQERSENEGQYRPFRAGLFLEENFTLYC